MRQQCSSEEQKDLILQKSQRKEDLTDTVLHYGLQKRQHHEILTGNTAEKWEQIKTHPFYAEELAKLREKGERFRSSDIPPLRYSAYVRYQEDGDRGGYEQPYFERRDRIACLALLTKLYGEKYLSALCDHIWAVLEEMYWTLPAHHYGIAVEQKQTHIALFSAETAALLAETDHVLGDVLPKEIRFKIKEAVQERVIKPYFERPFHWMYGDDNWGAVCSAHVALCIMYLGTHEDFLRAELTIRRTMELFLATYGSDGCCMEGLNYWSYGFGCFLNYADAVKNYTKEYPAVTWTEDNLPLAQKEAARSTQTGVIDYFQNENVKNAALFAMRMYLMGDRAVSFSDASQLFFYCPQHFYILKREYPDRIVYPSRQLARQTASNGGLGVIRHFLWSDPDAEYGAGPLTGTCYYPDAAWFIRNGDKYSFAAKGGCNSEPHNQNDIGSFLLTTATGTPLADLGCGEYTRQYFEPEYRYSFLVNSSLGHSLPIVDGRAQITGEQRAEVIEQTDHSFAIRFGFAYGYERIKEIERHFDCDEDGVTVTDRFTLTHAPDTLVERFVTQTEPILAAGKILLAGGGVLSYEEGLFDVTVTQEEYMTQGHIPALAYLIDLIAKKADQRAVYTFRLDIVKETEDR